MKYTSKGYMESKWVNLDAAAKSPDPQTRVWYGVCYTSTSVIMDDKTGIVCKYTRCTNPRTGSSLNMDSKYATADNQVLCVRNCMFGGQATKVKNLQCSNTDPQCSANRPKSSKSTVTVPAEYQNGLQGVNRTSPICLLNKVILCTTPSGRGQREKCAQGIDVKANCERCAVKKEVRCHAIVPPVKFGTPLLQKFTQAQRDMCKSVIKPCENIAR